MLPASKEPDSFTLLTVALVLSKHSWMDMDSQPTSSLVGLVRASEKVRPGTRQCTPRLRRRRRRPAGSSPGGARLKVTEIGEEERRGGERGAGAGGHGHRHHAHAAARDLDGVKANLAPLNHLTSETSDVAAVALKLAGETAFCRSTRYTHILTWHILI